MRVTRALGVCLNSSKNFIVDCAYETSEPIQIQKDNTNVSIFKLGLLENTLCQITSCDNCLV